MEVLLLGNGFDLSLGLPTHYSDFLEFVNYLSRNREQLQKENVTTKLSDIWKECRFENIEWVGELSLNKEYAKEIVELCRDRGVVHTASTRLSAITALKYRISEVHWLNRMLY